MEFQIGYKIFELSDENKLCTLFHATNGSRKIEYNKLYKTGSKLVRDNGPLYEEGFHFLKTKSEAEKYLRSFKKRLDKLVIKEVHVNKVHKKEHSPHNVFLSKEMIVYEHSL